MASCVDPRCRQLARSNDRRLRFRAKRPRRTGRPRPASRALHAMSDDQLARRTDEATQLHDDTGLSLMASLGLTPHRRVVASLIALPARHTRRSSWAMVSGQRRLGVSRRSRRSTTRTATGHLPGAARAGRHPHSSARRTIATLMSIARGQPLRWTRRAHASRHEPRGPSQIQTGRPCSSVGASIWLSTLVTVRQPVNAAAMRWSP